MKRWCTFLMIALLLVLALTMLQCGGGGGDDDDRAVISSGDDDDDDDSGDDDISGTPDDDDLSSDDDDDDTSDDDDTNDDDDSDDDDSWVDGGFDFATWAPCDDSNYCSLYLYATVSDHFVWRFASNINDQDIDGEPVAQLIDWRFPGDTIADTHDLHPGSYDLFDGFVVLIYVNAILTPEGIEDYDIAYAATGGSLEITEIGTSIGHKAEGKLLDADFEEVSIDGNSVTVVNDGAWGHIGQIDVKGQIQQINEK